MSVSTSNPWYVSDKDRFGSSLPFQLDLENVDNLFWDRLNIFATQVDSYTRFKARAYSACFSYLALAFQRNTHGVPREGYDLGRRQAIGG